MRLWNCLCEPRRGGGDLRRRRIGSPLQNIKCVHFQEIMRFDDPNCIEMPANRDRNPMAVKRQVQATVTKLYEELVKLEKEIESKKAMETSRSATPERYSSTIFCSGLPVTTADRWVNGCSCFWSFNRVFFSKKRIREKGNLIRQIIPSTLLSNENKLITDEYLERKTCSAKPLYSLSWYNWNKN